MHAAGGRNPGPKGQSGRSSATGAREPFHGIRRRTALRGLFWRMILCHKVAVSIEEALRGARYC